MLIDLSDIIKNYGGKLIISESFDMGKVDFLGEEFIFTAPCKIEGAILNNTKSLELNAEVTGEAVVHCARCQKPITIEVKFPISEVLVREDAEFMPDDDVLIYSGTSIELLEAITNSFLMNVSGKYLCSEDCRGLCMRCGINLNEQSCDCDKDNIDPRWEKLAEIMKNMSDTE